MKRNMSLAVLAFEVLAIVVLHTLKIHRLEQRGDEINNSAAIKHTIPEIKVQHILMLRAK